MILIRIQFLFWFIFLFRRDTTGFSISESNENNFVALPHQKELGEIFEAYDIRRMDNILKLLENKETDEFDEPDSSYKSSSLRFVVSLCKDKSNR